MADFTLPDEETKDITFGFKGEEFTITDVPARFWTKGLAGDLEGAVEELLNGHADRFWALRPTMGQVEALIDEMAKQIGTEPGKSEAPTPSPKGTATPSTPTSDATGG